MIIKISDVPAYTFPTNLFHTKHARTHPNSSPQAAVSEHTHRAFTFTPRAQQWPEPWKLVLTSLNEMSWHLCVFLNITSVSRNVFAHNFIPLKFSIWTLVITSNRANKHVILIHVFGRREIFLKNQFLEMSRNTRTIGYLSPKGYRDKDEGNKWQKNIRWSQPKLI